MPEREEHETLMAFVVESYAATDVTNGIVLGLTLSLMVIYVVMYVVIAVLERRKLPQGCLQMPAGDILDTDHYYYVVTVATGLRPGAGLDPSGLVQITLRGSAANSRPMVIRNLESSGATPVLKRASVDYFLLPVPATLGEVQKVDIDLYSLQYDSINWYIKHVWVTDVRCGTQYNFLFDRWLCTYDHLRSGVHQSRMAVCRLFCERFLSIFLDLHMWTSTWTRSSELGSFCRSVRISFCMMTLACLMVSNLLVCLILALEKKQSSVTLPHQAALIKEALTFGVVGNVVVLIVQYLFELLLRRVRVPVDHHLGIRGRNIWRKKPLPSSMYPVIGDGYYSGDAPGEPSTTPLLGSPEYKGNHKLVYSHLYLNNGRRSKNAATSTVDISDPRNEQENHDTRSKDSYRLPSLVEDEHEDELDGLQDGSGYFADDEKYEYKKVKSPMRVEYPESQLPCDICPCCSQFTCNSNMNANKQSPKVTDGKDCCQLIKDILWDEKDGTVAKYIIQQERLPKEYEVQDGNDNNRLDYESFAKYLVSLILKESKYSLASLKDKTSCIASIQDEVFKMLQKNCTKASDFIEHLRVPQSGKDDLMVHSQSSEGQIGGRGNKTDQGLSVTSSCPEVQSVTSSRSDVDQYGPVSTRLSESVTAIAFRNSYTALQKNANENLVHRSKERMASLTSLLHEADWGGCSSVMPSYTDTETRDEGKNGSEKMNVKKLMEFISPKRAERLTEKSMKYIARASLSSLLSDEALNKLQSTAVDYTDKAMQSFTYDVVNNLYNIVHGKLEELIDNHLMTDEDMFSTSKSERIHDFLTSAEEEIKSSVLPPLEEYIRSLLFDQSKSLKDIDVDLVMMAFSGQYVDTIITNAVLQTHVGLLKAKKSIESLHQEEKVEDSNINNNQEAAIQMALTRLEQTTEMESIVRQLCQCMLSCYRNKKGCTVEHPPAVDEAIRSTFVRSASTYDAFELVFTEAVNYLKLLSEHCDMAKVPGNAKLMSKLSRTFLVSGLDIDTHTLLTEELSSKLLDKALQHGCAVTAEHLVLPFLQPPPGGSVASHRGILKENVGEASPVRSPQKQQLRLDESPVQQKLEKSLPRPETESDDWTTASAGSPRPANTIPNELPVRDSETTSVRSPDGRRSARRSPTKSPRNRRSLGDRVNEKRSPYKENEGRSFTQSPDRFSPKSPMWSSTPRSGSAQSYGSKNSPRQWSPLRSVDDVDYGHYQQRDDKGEGFPHADILKVWPPEKQSVAGSTWLGSEPTSSMSLPLMPRDYPSMLSYDDNLSQTGSTGVVYIPSTVNVEIGENPSAEREKVWQLHLERELMGGTSKCIPSFMMHVLQVFMVVVTVAALSSCILFGLRLPNDSAVAWLVAIIVAIIQHALVWETLKVMAVAVYYVTCLDSDI